jgi:hypothetical protein
MPQVASVLRVQPFNVSSSTRGAAAWQAVLTTASINVTGCEGAPAALAPLLSAAGIAQPTRGTAAGSGTQLQLPALSLSGVRVARVASSAARWRVKSTPALASLSLRHGATAVATFSVQYTRGTGSDDWVVVSGHVTVTNPNLVEALTLVKVTASIVLPAGVPRSSASSSKAASADSSSSPVLEVLAHCPRDAASGAVAVSGQLVGSGALQCALQQRHCWRLPALKTPQEALQAAAG